MSTLNCAIIKDLIPSYLDDICSQESKAAVDIHLAECHECRRHLETLKQTEFVTGKSDQKQLDYMKKAKDHYARKCSLGAALLFGLCLLILPVIAKFQPAHEKELYYAIFATLAIGSYLLLSNYQEKPKTHWAIFFSITATVLGAAYPSILMAFLYRSLDKDASLLGMELSKAGPVLNFQLLLIVAVELMAFAFYAVDSVQKKHTFSILPALNLACCCLCMSYRMILFFMDDKQTLLAAILQDFAGFLLMAACILSAEFAIRKARHQIAKRIWGDI